MQAEELRDGGTRSQIDRRAFLKNTATIATTLAMPSLFAAEGDDWQFESVKKVHVIFKTHLDIGFTDLAANVIDTYFNKFIPTALSLSEDIRRQGLKDRFIWTTGSWLIYNYLESASPENRRRMENAITAGDIAWHGLPFTTHTELIDDSLFVLGTSLSAQLDKRFGRKTIAAKMTDVPGHCRAIVPLMHKANLAFLHIGVNGASTPPDVVPLFRWRADNSELIVMYHSQYGSTMTLPDNETAVAFCFTGDNHGPQTPGEVGKLYGKMRKQYPSADIFASTLDAVAARATQLQDRLPVVTQELGDTWIHGPASDPQRIARFRELSRLRRRWLAEGKLEEHSPTDIAFGSKLLMVAEHTWGVDIKRYLKDWSIYGFDELAEARKKPNFQFTESSWAEKRAYITQAVGALPAELAKEANRNLQKLAPVPLSDTCGKLVSDPASAIETKHFTIAVDPETGAVTTLKDRKTGRVWADRRSPLALFAYQTFSQADYDRFHNQYLTRKVSWALSDFGKPGMEGDNPQSRTCLSRLREMRTQDDATGFTIFLQMDVPHTDQTSCPRRLTSRLFLPSDEPAIHVDFAWFDKPAYRLPEAMWLSFVPVITDENGFLLDKMNHAVSPLDVVKNGNRSLHGIISGVKYKDSAGYFQLDSLDAFLVAPGKKSLLNFDDAQPVMKDGLHFCLCNNVWGTNFMMWFEDDMRFRFKLTFA